ncbi:MAG: FHA domain-containing protein [Armatimonadetes bacterium]|nr:FHA domain-containing protein [Armatimonadota bacterium]
MNDELEQSGQAEEASESPAGHEPDASATETEEPEAETPEPEEQPEDGAWAELRLVRGGQPTGEVFAVARHAVIGRFDADVGPIDVDLAPIQEGVYISRKHAEIRYEGGRWLLRDLGSSNGTFVLMPGGSFNRISDETEIEDGQQVAFGNAQFRFHVVGPPEQAADSIAETEVEPEDAEPEEAGLSEEPAEPEPEAPQV